MLEAVVAAGIIEQQEQVAVQAALAVVVLVAMERLHKELELLGLPILGAEAAVALMFQQILQAAQVVLAQSLFATPAQFNISLVAQ